MPSLIADTGPIPPPAAPVVAARDVCHACSFTIQRVRVLLTGFAAWAREGCFTGCTLIIARRLPTVSCVALPSVLNRAAAAAAVTIIGVAAVARLIVRQDAVAAGRVARARRGAAFEAALYSARGRASVIIDRVVVITLLAANYDAISAHR